MKRILIFSLAYYPHVGGAEVALKEITDRIADIEFHMLTLRFSGEPREEKVGNIFVHRIGNGSSYSSKMLFIPRAAFAARALDKKYSFDLLWAMMSYMLLPVVLARLAVPYILTLQEGDPWEHMFSRWFILPIRPLLVRGFRKAAKIQVISSYLGGWAKRMGYQGDVVVVPNGVDLGRFVVTRTSSSAGTVLVTASRLVKKNAIDDVIRALVLLDPSIRLRVFGSGPEEASLQRLAGELGVADRVEWKGHVSHDVLPAALAAADIFVRPSRSEGMGNAFIEAMAAGLPVIGTREGGIADFLFHKETGWVVEKDSPEQIAAAVKAIVAHPDDVRRVTQNAKKMVAEKYEWGHVARQMREVFATLGV